MKLPPVVLRKVLITDAMDLATLHADPDYQKWLGGCTTVERCENSIRTWTRKMNDDISWYYSVLDATGKFVGFCTIIEHDDDGGSYHLTIGVCRNSQKKGYGEAAVTEAINLAKQQPKIMALVALVEDGNTGSRKLMSKFDPNPTSAMAVRIIPDRTVKEWTFRLYNTKPPAGAMVQR